MNICNADKCVIKDLLEKRFKEICNRKTEDNKRQEVLPTLSMSTKTILTQRIFRFHNMIFDIYQLLTANKSLNELFCWPCLLFSKSDKAWSFRGSDNLNNLHTSQKNTKILKHICNAHWTFCIVVTKELMRLLTINLNIIKQFIKTEKSGMSN
jgi:hypothetical protein